jgi:hypothetical protein
MSTNQEMQFPNQPVHSTSAGSTGKGLLIGGCGCLTVLTVICIGGAIWGYLRYAKPTLDFMNETKVLISESPQVKEILGEPINVGDSEAPSTVGNTMIFRYPVSGSKGRGTVVVEADVPSATNFELKRNSMVLEFNGEKIDLDLDAVTPDIDIKFGEHLDEEPQ